MREKKRHSVVSGGEIESVLLVVFVFFSLGQIPPQTSSSGLKGGALYHPVGLVQSLEELLLLLLRQEARFCRLDVLQDKSGSRSAKICWVGNIHTVILMFG